MCAITRENAGDQTDREKNRREQKRLKIKERDRGKMHTRERCRNKKQQRYTGEDRQVSDEFRNRITRAGDRLRKHKRPLAPFALGTTHASQHCEQRNEIERHLDNEKRNCVRIFAEERRRESAEERESSKDLKISINQRGA